MRPGPALKSDNISSQPDGSRRKMAKPRITVAQPLDTAVNTRRQGLTIPPRVVARADCARPRFRLAPEWRVHGMAGNMG